MSKTFDPQEAILALHAHLGSWRAVAAHVGAYSGAYWCLVGHGMRPSRQAENALRRRLGVAPRGVTHVADMPTGELAWYMRNRQPMSQIAPRARV